VTTPEARHHGDLAAYATAVPQSVVDAISSARSILAVGHENPDADTLGATLAITVIARELGIRATAASSDLPPPLYAFLPGVGEVRNDPDPAAHYDLLVVSDCATFERVGARATRNQRLFAELPRVVIDHHVSNDANGPTDWIDPASAATCEMVALLATRLGVPLDSGDGALATALMGGIVMDTATFAHPNATPRTLSVAAALLAAGAPLSEISRLIYRSKPDAQLRLFGRVLERMSSTDDGRVVWSRLLERDLAETGAEPAQSEGIIDLLSQADRAEVAILFKEQTDGTTRLSVRTRPGGVDATVLTGVFGGGGHARAAGATVQHPIAEAEPLVLAEARRLTAQVGRSEA